MTINQDKETAINIDGITDSEVLCLTNDDKEKLCNELHKFEHFFRWRTNRWICFCSRRLLSFMNNKKKCRYAKLLEMIWA